MSLSYQAFYVVTSLVSLFIKEIFPSMITIGQSKYITSGFFLAQTENIKDVANISDIKEMIKIFLRAGVRIL